MKKRILYILPGLFGIAFISLVLIGNLGPSEACVDKKNFINSNYTGILKQKYLDKENHNYRTLVFSYNNTLFNMVLLDDTSGYYEYVKIGDTITKIKDNNYIQVNKSNKFKIYYNCK